MLFCWEANPHFGPFHLLSFAFIGGGFVLISAAWKVLYDAQRQRELATTGVYAYVRHPQYGGFILVMFGFLLQSPTLLPRSTNTEPLTVSTPPALFARPHTRMLPFPGSGTASRRERVCQEVKYTE